MAPGSSDGGGDVMKRRGFFGLFVGVGAVMLAPVRWVRAKSARVTVGGFKTLKMPVVINAWGKTADPEIVEKAMDELRFRVMYFGMVENVDELSREQLVRLDQLITSERARG